MEPSAKRQLRPTASLPTTAEKYGAQFQLPDEVQRALLNVGPKGRYSVAHGRNFDRTQSFPVTSSTTSSSSTVTFRTASQTYRDAQQIIHKEQLRARELKPYSETLSDSNPEQPRNLSSSPAKRAFDERHLTGVLIASKKRRSSPAEPDDEVGSDTEVEEEDEAMPELDTSASTEDFPAVFRSPKITQPELFARPVEILGRTTKNLPGRLSRSFGKTRSAPVGQIGWGSMEIDARKDGEMEDGFDVREWAASEEF